MRLARLMLSCLILTACIRPRAAYNGVLDSANCGAIHGWAFDWNRLSVPSEVAIYDGDTLIQKIKADLPRPDLKLANNNHGFFLSPPPAVLFDRKPHTIHVRFGDSKQDLRQSPKPLRCPDEPR